MAPRSSAIINKGVKNICFFESIKHTGMATTTTKKSTAKKSVPSKPITTEIDLQQALQEQFGFKQFKGQQKAIIESVLAGRDTFVIMPTGGGKSLCYQLPAIIQSGVAIIVSPLIALMKNQVDLVRGYSSKTMWRIF